MLDLSRAKAVRDVGCGEGHDLRQIASRLGSGCRLVGIDSRTQVVEVAMAKAGP